MSSNISMCSRCAPYQIEETMRSLALTPEAVHHLVELFHEYDRKPLAHKIFRCMSNEALDIIFSEVGCPTNNETYVPAPLQEILTACAIRTKILQLGLIDLSEQQKQQVQSLSTQTSICCPSLTYLKDSGNEGSFKRSCAAIPG